MQETVQTKKKKYRYFLYSSSQYKERLDIERNIGRTYVPGVVYYKGRKYDYTEIVDDVSKARYPDSKVVAEGYLEDLKYEKSKHNWGVVM